MENLEQIISKQNNIKEKITEYNNELELYNKTYIEKFTELKSLKDELRDEKRSVQKDDEKIKMLNFKIKNMNNEVSFMYTQVKDINSNISELKLELEQLKEELLENPEVKIAVYAEEKRRVQELKDAKILEKREIDTLLQNNPKDISEIPSNIAEKISKDSLYKKYDEQISNFTELLNTSSNPKAKSSLENKIKTLKKEKEEFLVSKLKEISSEYQNSIHIYEKDLQTLSVKEAKVLLDRHSEINTTKTTSNNVDISKEEVNEKDNSEEKTENNGEKSDINQNNNSNDSKDDKDDVDNVSKENDKEDITTTEVIEYNPTHLPKKMGFFEKMKEKFKKAKEWFKEKLNKFKENVDKENDILDAEIVDENIKENTKEENENTKSKEQEFENKTEKDKEEDKDINVDNDSKETSKDENEQNEEIAEESKEYTGSKYTQDEILDNEDIRKKIEDYMNNLEKKQKDNSNKEKENSTKESKEKEEI